MGVDHFAVLLPSDATSAIFIKNPRKLDENKISVKDKVNRYIILLSLIIVLLTSCSVLKKVTDTIGITDSDPKVEKAEKKPNGIRIFPKSPNESEQGSVPSLKLYCIIAVIILIVLIIARKLLFLIMR